jgi:choline monooxygenase
MEVFPGGVLQTGIAREGEVCFDIPESSPDYGERIAAYYLWLFPNLMINLYPWGLSLNMVVPKTATTCRVLYRGYLKDASLVGGGAGGNLDTVELQDQEIVEAIQRGMGSKSYDRGRYSPTMEIGVHHFHQMLTN